METEVESIQGKVPITILALCGELDASNFEAVIAKTKQLYETGTRHLLLDISGLTFMSSSGLVALHSIILLMRGEKPTDTETGWSAFRAIERDFDSGRQPYVKIVSPQPKVLTILQKTGMDHFFEIFSDRQTALASY